MPKCRFFGVDADHREVEVTDEFLELRWSGSLWHRVHFASICCVQYNAHFAYTPVRVRDGRAKDGYIDLEIAWHTDHDAQNFAAAVDRLVAKATHEALHRVKRSGAAMGAK